MSKERGFNLAWLSSFLMMRYVSLQRSSFCQTAFTLIELLVVITIVAILAGILLPTFGLIQKRGYETKTLSNMRQMGIAFLAYSGDNNYQLPSRANAAADGTTPDKWPRTLRPYLQDLRVYGSPIADVGGKTYKVTDPQFYLNNGTNYTSYIYNGGNDVVTFGTNGNFPRLNGITELNATILLGIPLPQANNFYMDFAEQNNSQILNKKAFDDGTPYMFCDGSVRVLTAAVKVGNVPVNNKQRPPDSGTYTDWLWLFNKSHSDTIQ